MLAYQSLQSYEDILMTGFRETTGPIQLKKGVVRFAGVSKQRALVHYFFRPSESEVTRKNPSGSAAARVLMKTSDHDVAFKAILANITGTEKNAQSERVVWDQQLYRAKDKVFWYIFSDSKSNNLGSAVESGWWDQFAGHAQDPVKRLLAIMKYHGIIVKGRDY